MLKVYGMLLAGIIVVSFTMAMTDDGTVAPANTDPADVTSPANDVKPPSDTHEKCLTPGKRSRNCQGWCGTKTGCNQCCARVNTKDDEVVSECLSNCARTFDDAIEPFPHDENSPGTESVIDDIYQPTFALP